MHRWLFLLAWSSWAIPTAATANPDGALSLLTANVGNTQSACRYADYRLCHFDVEARAARHLAVLSPDIVLLQEVLPGKTAPCSPTNLHLPQNAPAWRQATWEAAPTGKIHYPPRPQSLARQREEEAAETGMAYRLCQDPSGTRQVDRLLPGGYTAVCDDEATPPGGGSRCTAVKTAVLDGTPPATARLVRTKDTDTALVMDLSLRHNHTLRVINVHNLSPRVDFLEEGARFTLDVVREQVRSLFASGAWLWITGNGSATAVLMAGDFNTASDSLVDALRQAAAGVPEVRLLTAWDTPTLRLFDGPATVSRRLDFVFSNALTPAVPCRLQKGAHRLDGGGGMDHRAWFCPALTWRTTTGGP